MGLFPVFSLASFLYYRDSAVATIYKVLPAEHFHNETNSTPKSRIQKENSLLKSKLKSSPLNKKNPRGPDSNTKFFTILSSYRLQHPELQSI
ncbi:hypothetical protein BDV18DRAFT_144394 [Aspergillus unguis]